MDFLSDPTFLSRLQFALTTMFHIIWPLLSIGLSLILVIMEVLWLKTGDVDYYRHLRFWSKLLLLNFAVGVVSGLPLEFQFGTNWERFSVATGGFFGSMLGFEGAFAFMLEAAFLYIMLFGWGRVSRGLHLFATCMVALGASLSAFFIMVANSWMQTPAGGYFQDGKFVTTSYLQAIFNPDLPWGFSHMWVACLETSLFVLGGLSAWYLLKDRHSLFFRKSFRLAVWGVVLIAPLQVLLGDGSGRAVAKYQPTKLGAIESHWQTNPPGQGAAYNAIAWPNSAQQRNDFALKVPYGLSLLITRSFTGTVRGLREFPRQDQPPVIIPYFSFRIMLAAGFGMLFLMLGTMWFYWRGGWRLEEVVRRKWLLWAWIGAIPAAYAAVETGWIVREVGRQPWVIFGHLRTAEASSLLPASSVAFTLSLYVLFYAVLSAAFGFFAWRILAQGPDLEATPPPPRGGTGQAGR